MVAPSAWSLSTTDVPNLDHAETMVINEVSTLAPTSGKGQPKYQ